VFHDSVAEDSFFEGDPPLLGGLPAIDPDRSRARQRRWNRNARRRRELPQIYRARRKYRRLLRERLSVQQRAEAFLNSVVAGCWGDAFILMCEAIVYARSRDVGVPPTVPAIALWDQLARSYIWHPSVLRMAQWCELKLPRWELDLGLGGFHGPTAPRDQVAHHLFDLCRSDLAIQRAGPALGRCFNFLAGHFDEDVDPIRLPSPLSMEEAITVLDEDSLPSPVVPPDISLSVAAVIVFSAARLGRSSAQDRALVDRACQVLLHHQHPSGGWACWRRDHVLCTDTTAKAIHALALAKPDGWQESIQAAAGWLGAYQDEDGHWGHDGGLQVHGAVLALDALELARGGTRLTFGLEGPVRGVGHDGQDHQVHGALGDATLQTLNRGAQESVFQRRGDVWFVEYDGQGCFVSDMKGMSYIGQLLMKPNGWISGLELAGSQPSGNSRSVVGVAELEQDDDPLQVGESGHATMDEQAVKDVEDRMFFLKDAIQEARKANDQEELAKLESEFSYLAKEVKAAKGLGGRQRSLGMSAAEKAADAVRQAMKRALSGMQSNEQTRAFVDHFREAEHREGGQFSYQPKRQISWHVQL
jgi:hypothetical protein